MAAGIMFFIHINEQHMLMLPLQHACSVSIVVHLQRCRGSRSCHAKAP